MYLKKNYFFGAANVKSQKGMILAGELQFYQLPVGISLLTPCCKRGNTAKEELDATSIQHPPMLGLSITISICVSHYLFRRRTESRARAENKCDLQKNNLCSRTNIQAFCKVKREYYAHYTGDFFWSASSKPFKTIYCRKRRFIFLHNEIFWTYGLEIK